MPTLLRTTTTAYINAVICSLFITNWRCCRQGKFKRDTHTYQATYCLAQSFGFVSIELNVVRNNAFPNKCMQVLRLCATGVRCTYIVHCSQIEKIKQFIFHENSLCLCSSSNDEWWSRCQWAVINSKTIWMEIICSAIIPAKDAASIGWWIAPVITYVVCIQPWARRRKRWMEHGSNRMKNENISCVIVRLARRAHQDPTFNLR